MTGKAIRLSKSVVGRQEAEAVSRLIMEDGYLGMGNEVRLFEEEIAQFLGVPTDTVMCVNSGTAALHLSVGALLEPGQEVLVQSLTFVASFEAVSAAGAVPVPCEVDPRTVTIDLEDAQSKITSATKAIMPVHYAGNPGDLTAIYEFAGHNNLRVIEDAAHAFGGTYRGKKIGSFGDVICFSFDGIKNITSGEGGCVVTRDKRVAERVQDARLLGVEHDTVNRYAGQRSWEFDVRSQGYRYHMSNIFAAIGRVQLRRIDNEFAPRRRMLACAYRRLLDGCPDIAFFDADYAEVVPHIFPVRIPDGKRDLLKKYLEDLGIGTGIHYKPNHLLTYYGAGRVSLPGTEKIFSEIMSLPLHPALKEEDLEFICGHIRRYLSREEVHDVP
jgi:dTDP-4-amino-4,6-dideoxygalactose transaminase